MKPTLHIYTAPLQPATNFVDRSGLGKPMRIKWSPHKLLYCRTCNRLRRAKNLNVQVFYDDLRFFCKDKTQCQPKRKAKR